MSETTETNITNNKKTGDDTNKIKAKKNKDTMTDESLVKFLLNPKKLSKFISQQPNKKALEIISNLENVALDVGGIIEEQNKTEQRNKECIENAIQLLKEQGIATSDIKKYL